MNILLDLFLTFAKIGLFTFGGGYAMISMIENNCVERKQWITHDEMMNVTVIAESTPGPIAINCATFTGYKKAGFIGALVATLGIVVPSFVVIYLISFGSFPRTDHHCKCVQRDQNCSGHLDSGCGCYHDKEDAQKETAKSDYALLLRGHAVYQYFRMELFFYQLNADCSSCQSDDFYSE